ncbi:membrane-associated proteins in eicosanoid and glutathione metabolism [Choiromyces venosus 120613-1]|uniref:Membrane-associated proteins in eicosanoid and glutathione metabolism n=1 Tax=Choiromyces venosus 120613-1 TaxID=1336337 RepID=A0A3N4K5Y3_9PEZI|nr:membrane-associated proteins in eicosanoid and glutathione metabolism [Choiromyces venosus 120613-1]
MTLSSIPHEYSYVLASLFATALVSQYHGIIVGSIRKKAKVPYPNAYASAEDASKDKEKFRFNCAQRAHANYLESLSVVLPAFLASAIHYPTVASSLFGIWLVGRVVYTHGYTGSQHNSTGNGRYKGMFYSIGQVGLAITAGMSAWKLYNSGL